MNDRTPEKRALTRASGGPLPLLSLTPARLVAASARLSLTRGFLGESPDNWTQLCLPATNPTSLRSRGSMRHAIQTSRVDPMHAQHGASVARPGGVGQLCETPRFPRRIGGVYAGSGGTARDPASWRANHVGVSALQLPLLRPGRRSSAIRSTCTGERLTTQTTTSHRRLPSQAHEIWESVIATPRLAHAPCNDRAVGRCSPCARHCPGPAAA